MLTIGAIEALFNHADDQGEKQAYFAEMCEGASSGAVMNLTEPGAGARIWARVAVKALPKATSTYAISSQKIVHHLGEQEITEKLSNLVLARLPMRRRGVPRHFDVYRTKYLVNADGSLGRAQPGERGGVGAQAQHPRAQP